MSLSIQGLGTAIPECWIDQADDYRLRGDRTRTENALKQVYGEP